MISLSPARFPRARQRRFRVTAATPEDREAIYRLRHDVYSQELQQHPGNAAGRLTDALDDFNHYLVVRREGVLTGFISITPPGHGRYSLDKYFTRAELPFACDDHLFEVRLLTVLPNARGRATAALLMYAALRWVEAHGGTRIAAIGRREILNLYYRAGLQPTGLWAQSGAVAYELLHAETASLRANLDRFAPLLARLEATTKWELGIAFRQPAACFHGGRFFTAIGARFDHLTRRDEVINADVLDAWFAPSPRVVEALRACLPWLLRTSPPVQAEGLVEVIAETRGVPAECLLVGAGSSDLIFRALRAWLSPASHALLPDPTYGEYAHVLERVVGCRVARLALRRAAHYRPDLAELEAAMARGYDLVVLVNPNSPTGQFIPRRLLQPLLEAAPPTTRVWIDEAYLEYAGNDQSLEAFAARSENVMVCKSMSKVYALSGTRAAYLCAAPHQLESLRAVTPPWMVSLPGQVAAVNALQDPAYYAARHHETRQLREVLAGGLEGLGWNVVPGCANFLLAHLPTDGPSAAEVVRRCEARGLFLRDAGLMSARLGNRIVRVAVKDADTQGRMLAILQEVLGFHPVRARRSVAAAVPAPTPLTDS